MGSHTAADDSIFHTQSEQRAYDHWAEWFVYCLEGHGDTSLPGHKGFAAANAVKELNNRLFTDARYAWEHREDFMFFARRLKEAEDHYKWLKRSEDEKRQRLEWTRKDKEEDKILANHASEDADPGSTGGRIPD